MLKNYLKTAWRNILKNKGYSALNILGLASGIGVVLIISLWIYTEYSYDRFLPHFDQLYQVKMNHIKDKGEVNTMDATSLALVEVLNHDIPEIQYVVESDQVHDHGLIAGERKLLLDGQQVGSDFLRLFQFTMLEGDRATCLKEPYSIVLTASTARSLFGNEDPMGKIVKLDNKDGMKVTGVLKDLPGNSSFRFHYLVPFSYFEQTKDWMKGARSQWMNNSFQVFVGLRDGVTYGQVEPKIRNIVRQHTKEMNSDVMLHPIKEWRLYSEFKNGKAVGGFIDYVRMFGIVGILVLCIACINFINLSTARSEKRAKEVGVRKAIGSGRRELILQFLIESVMLTFMAFAVSVLLVQLVIPSFNTLIKSSVHIPYGSPVFWLIMIGSILVVGLLSGSRPAFYLSSFRPAKVLKGSIKTGKEAALPRKILMILQFSYSVALIISTMVIYRQVNYVKERPVGYRPENLMMTKITDDLQKNYEALKTELTGSGLVENITKASSPATDVKSHTVIEDWPQKTSTDKLSVGVISTSETYFNTLGIKIKSGRNFYENWQADTSRVIINESAARTMGLTDPVGQIITWNRAQRATIVGVVEDAIMESPFTPVAPTVFVHGRGGNDIIYRLSASTKMNEAIERVGAIFNKYNPAYPYSYLFVSEEYARKFNLELLIGKLAGLFAGLAVFISCLGLFGLVAFLVDQRTKEIGIRKVLGASVPQLWFLLSKDFFLLVLISCVIASPVAWYFLQGWLEQYEYRISIGFSVFIVATLLALLITFFTISFKSISAALVSPSKSMRND